MTRTEYLNQLEKYLRKLPKADFESAMQHFTEYFEEAGEAHEQSVINELGSPKEAAADLLHNLLKKDMDQKNPSREKTASSLVRTMTLVFLAILLTPISVPILCGVLLILFLALLFLIIALAVFLYAGSSLIFQGGTYFIEGLTAFFHSSAGGCILSGTGMFGIGSGILFLLLTLYLCRTLILVCTRLIIKIMLRRNRL